MSANTDNKTRDLALIALAGVLGVGVLVVVAILAIQGVLAVEAAVATIGAVVVLANGAIGRLSGANSEVVK